MDKYSECRWASYISLIFAGSLTVDGGAECMLTVLLAFVIFHLVGKFLFNSSGEADTHQVVPWWKFILYALLVVIGPWAGLLACMFE